MLLQARPPTRESGEGIPIDKEKQQGITMNNKAMKQQWGEPKRYLEKANNNGKQLTTNKADHQGAMAGQQGPITSKARW